MFFVSHIPSASHYCSTMLTVYYGMYLYLHPRTFFWPDWHIGQAGSEVKCLWKYNLTNEERGTDEYILQLPLPSIRISSVQFNWVTQSCPTLSDPMNHSTPGLPVHHQLPDFTQTHVRRVSDTIQLSHPLLSPSPPASNPSQHQSIFQWVNSLHEVANVLEFQF